MKIKKNGHTRFDLFVRRMFFVCSIFLVSVCVIFLPLFSKNSASIAKAQEHVDTLENNKKRLEYTIRDLIDSDPIFQAIQKMLNN